MKVLVWTHNSALDERVTGLVSALGGIIFRSPGPGELAELARKEQPMLVLLGPGPDPGLLTECVETLANHPDTRWTPIVLLTEAEAPQSRYSSLLDRGAGAVIDCTSEPELVAAQFRALHRSALRLATLRSTRLTDEKTGFYHQSFLLDQLQVLCRKKRRDGIPFCLLFVELRGEETEVHKAALSLSSTVRGADLFGRWEGDLFAVLLPSSQPAQAHLLAQRCQRLLCASPLEARAALISSDSEAVEAEALVEAALNALDEGWRQGQFLWSWDGPEGVARPLEVHD